MICGNHDRRKGDIVTVARWDESEMKSMRDWYRCNDPGAIKFYVRDIDYGDRQIVLAPMPSKANHQIYYRVSLDETNLLKAGQLS